MNMTHYMSLLASNQPWNLIIFMAVPVICAEALTISEFFIIFNRKTSGGLRTFNKVIGIFDGFYFSAIFIYLMINVVIHFNQLWRMAYLGRRCSGRFLFKRCSIPFTNRFNGA